MKPLDLDYPLKNSSVFICGPVKMVENYAKNVRNKDKNVDLTFEAFKIDKRRHVLNHQMPGIENSWYQSKSCPKEEFSSDRR